MSGFRVGETVDITIRGAKVEKTTSDPLIHVALPNGFRVMVDPTSDAVTVERTLPPGWPPQVADVWLDRDGDAWFCVDNGSDGRVGRYLMSATGNDKYIKDVAEEYGPLVLAFRVNVDDEATS